VFGFGKSKKDEKPKVETVCFYEGEVICGDYDVKDPSLYPFHNLFPHGQGKITYTDVATGEVVESYEGHFDGGAYHGPGKLMRFGEMFEGQFSENEFVNE